MELSGKVALVTGGASGIGAAACRRLAALGARIVVADVDEERGRAVAGDTDGRFHRLDVTSLTSNHAVVAEIEVTEGHLDIAFLNAGIVSPTRDDEPLEEAAYRRIVGINLDGVVFGVHAAIPALRRRGGGSIVATASMAGLTGTPFDPVYGANKHAVVGLVRALGPALAPDGIKVNAFCPGFAETKIITDIKSTLQASGVPIIPVEVAGEAVLQAFDSHETGQAFLLQAGRDVMVYKFRGIPGPLDESGAAARPADPTGIPTGMAEPPPA